MICSTNDDLQNLTNLACEIVAAYVANNSLPVSELPTLITNTHATLVSLAKGSTSYAAGKIDAEKPSAAEIRKSVQHDGITSFIDGRTYKTLKRHLAANGLHPRSYCELYGLPTDYPMVAPSYAERRSALAKAIGLGVPGARADQRRTGTGG